MPQRTPAADRENLAGLVERVTFHNADSGFCVLRVKARGQRDLVTIIGHAAAIGAGEFVQASGRWINERTLAWFARFRWLIVRYERRLDILLGFHLFAAGLVCLRIVARWPCQAF